MKLYIILSVVSLFSLSCGTKQPQDQSPEKYLTIGSNKVLCPDSVYFSRSRFTPLETTPESILDRVVKVAYDDHLFFIVDQRREAIFVFDKQGKFVRRIQKTGRGPGEYTHINAFTLNTKKKQIVVISDSGRLLYYDYQGKCVQEEPLPNLFREINYAEGSLIATISEVDAVDGTYCYAANEKGEKGEPLLDYPKVPYTNLFSGGSFLTRTDQLRVTNRFDRSIYSIKQGRIKKDFEIDFGSFNLPEALLSGTDGTALQEACSSGKYVYTISNASDYGRYLFFSTNFAGFFVYDKQSDHLTRYEGIRDMTIKTNCSLFLPIENMKSTLAFVIYPSFHIPAMSRAKKMGGIIPKEEEGAFRNVKEEDNPVLLLYDFR